MNSELLRMRVHYIYCKVVNFLVLPFYQLSTIFNYCQLISTVNVILQQITKSSSPKRWRTEKGRWKLTRTVDREIVVYLWPVVRVKAVGTL
jgi:hypothetical protein